jgi:hypothetical protein
MLMEVIHMESELKSFSWADGLYIIVSEKDGTYNMCKLDEKGQPELYDHGGFMITCTGTVNKGITRTKLKYNHID